MIYRFGNIEVHADRRELRRDEAWIQTEPKVFDVLLFLIENRDRAVPRDELLQSCWPNIYVSDGTLSRCLSRVRQAIGQSRSANEPMRTLHGRGYRFVAQLEIIGQVPDAAPPVAPTPDRVPPAPGKQDQAARREITAVECAVSLKDPAQNEEPAEALLKAIDRFLVGIQDMVESHSGQIVRVSGNAILTHFGYAVSPEIPARSGVLAAFEMMHRAEAQGLDVRIGVVSTRAIVTRNPVATANDWIVVGTDPLEPALFCNLAAPGECVVDGPTMRLTHDIATSGPARDVHIAGTATEAYALTAIAAAADDDDLPFFGRRVEILNLEQLWELAQSGRGQAIVVSGEPGVGKTRLVEELIARAGIPEASIMHASCTPNHRYTSFYPLLSEIRDAIGITKDTPALLQLAAVEQVLERLGWPESYHLPILASLLSLNTPVRQMPRLRLDPARQRANTLEAVVRLVLELTGEGPSLIWLDDVQWADPSTWKTLRALSESVANRRCLLVMTCRSGFEIEDLAETPARRLGLEPFSSDEIRLFLKQRSDDQALASGLIDVLTERSGGNPLYLREYLQLAEHDAGASPDDELPLTLRTVLASRVQQLGALQDLAQWASVLGRKVPKAALGALCAPEGGLDAALQKLADLGIFSRTRSTSDVVEFKHMLLRDAAYDTMLASQQQQRHRAVAQALVQTDPKSALQSPERIAQHFDMSDTPGQAAIYWQQAGDNAARVSSEEARQHYERALSAARLVTTTGQKADVEEEIERLLAAL